MGIKQEKKVTDGSAITKTQYAGNYIYENTGSGNKLKFFNHPEGYVEPSTNGFNYVYQYKDHLGNIRLSYKNVSTTSTPSLEIIEENNYYPFGLKHKGYNNVINGTHHPYGYGGKEESNDPFDWKTLDFGARNYDPALGRWMNLDPLAELMTRHSPYSYAFDNPIYYIDPDGMEVRESQIAGVLVDFHPFGLDVVPLKSKGGWKSQVNNDGSTSYIAEDGATLKSFGLQYGLKKEVAEKIVKEALSDSPIKKGSVISGEIVNKVTGSPILKLDLDSKYATDQRRYDQFIFGRDHSTTGGKKVFAHLSTDYYSNTKYKNLITGLAYMTIDDKIFKVHFRIPVYRSVVTDGSSTATGLGNRPFSNNVRGDWTKYFDKTDRIQFSVYHPNTAANNGHFNINVSRSYSNLLQTRFSKRFPKYHYAPTMTTLKY